MRLAGPHASHEPKAGEAAVPQEQIAWLQALGLLRGQFHLPHGGGFQTGVQAQVVEQVVEHTHPGFGIGGAGRAVPVGERFLAKGLRQGRRGRQAQHRAVHAQEPMTVPSAALGGRFGPLGQGQEHLLVEFDERAGLELGAGLCPSAGRDGRRQGVGQPLGQELVEMALDRLGGFLEQEQEHNGEGERALAGEVNGAQAMAREKERIAQAGAQGFDELDQVTRNGPYRVRHGRSMYTL